MSLEVLRTNYQVQGTTDTVHAVLTECCQILWGALYLDYLLSLYCARILCARRCCKVNHIRLWRRIVFDLIPLPSILPYATVPHRMQNSTFCQPDFRLTWFAAPILMVFLRGREKEYPSMHAPRVFPHWPMRCFVLQRWTVKDPLLFVTRIDSLDRETKQKEKCLHRIASHTPK